MAVVKNIDVALRANVEKFEAGLKKGGELVERFRGQIVTAAAGFATFAAASNVAHRAVNSLVRNFEEIDAAHKAATSIGIATGELIKLRFAVSEVAGAAVDIDNALKMMNRNIAEAAAFGGRGTKVFESLGLNLQKLSRTTPEKAFQQITDAISRLDTQGKKTLASMEIFGRQGKEMGVLFEGTGKAIKDASQFAEQFGLNVSQIDATAIEKFNDELERSRTIIKGIGIRVASDLAQADSAAKGLLETMGINLDKVKAKLASFTARSIVGGQIAGLADMGRVLAMQTENMAKPLRDLEKIAPPKEPPWLKSLRESAIRQRAEELNTMKAVDAVFSASRTRSEELSKAFAERTADALKKAIERKHALTDEADRLREHLATPFERFEASVMNLRRLRIGKFINEDIFSRGIRDAMSLLGESVEVKEPVAGPAALGRGTQEAFSAFQANKDGRDALKEQLALQKKMEAHLAKIAKGGITLAFAPL